MNKFGAMGTLAIACFFATGCGTTAGILAAFDEITTRQVVEFETVLAINQNLGDGRALIATLTASGTPACYVAEGDGAKVRSLEGGDLVQIRETSPGVAIAGETCNKLQRFDNEGKDKKSAESLAAESGSIMLSNWSAPFLLEMYGKERPEELFAAAEKLRKTNETARDLGFEDKK